MNDIVERVAKAQNALAVKHGYITAWETLDEEQRSAALELARVAIETMTARKGETKMDRQTELKKAIAAVEGYLAKAESSAGCTGTKFGVGPGGYMSHADLRTVLDAAKSR